MLCLGLAEHVAGTLTNCSQSGHSSSHSSVMNTRRTYSLMLLFLLLPHRGHIRENQTPF